MEMRIITMSLRETVYLVHLICLVHPPFICETVKRVIASTVKNTINMLDYLQSKGVSHSSFEKH